MCKFSSLAALTLLLACDANLGSVAPSESDSEGDELTTGEDEGEPVPCIGGQLCPEGTSCANGLCATECSSDTGCDADEYCGQDGLCHANTVPSCNSDLDCAATQTCVEQTCVALGDGCDPENWLQDGCASNAICLADYEMPEQGICYEMPACESNQTCPIGLEGAVCNTGQLPTKDEICLVGLCDTVTNCPEFWFCVHYDNSVLGFCSDGGFGSPCTEDAQCLSGNCVPVPGVGGGFCS